MRTTITLDKDVAERLKRETASGKITFKQAVNDALRAGFGMTAHEPRAPYRVNPHASAYTSGVDPRRLNQLADELEADAFLEKQRHT